MLAPVQELKARFWLAGACKENPAGSNSTPERTLATMVYGPRLKSKGPQGENLSYQHNNSNDDVFAEQSVGAADCC